MAYVLVLVQIIGLELIVVIFVKIRSSKSAKTLLFALFEVTKKPITSFCADNIQCNNNILLQCINGVCDCYSTKYYNGTFCGMSIL